MNPVPTADRKQRFRHAMHIIQSPDWSSVPIQTPWTDQTPPPPDVMLLEYCKRGSLYKAVCTARTKRLKFPERALWHMFHCRKLIHSFREPRLFPP